MVEAVNDDGRYLETHEGELYKGKTVRGWPGPARTRDTTPVWELADGDPPKVRRSHHTTLSPSRDAILIPRLLTAVSRRFTSRLVSRLEFLWRCTGPWVLDHVLYHGQHGCINSTGLHSAGIHNVRGLEVQLGGPSILTFVRSSGSKPTIEVASPFSAAGSRTIGAKLEINSSHEIRES